MRWSYGVTTVESRRRDLLPRTLQSLSQAGFDRPRLFLDGVKASQAASWEDQFGLEVTTRYPIIRPYGNWILALAELYIRNPSAERYAIFQDDFVTYPNLRKYLDRCPYPDGQIYNDVRRPLGYWNLYTFPSNQALCPTGSDGRELIGWYPTNQLGYGAVALVFDRATTLMLLQSQHMIHRPMDDQRGHRKIDGGIVNTLRKAGYTELVHNPSLTQHLGLRSTIGNHNQKQARSFRGEEFDATQLTASTR